MLPKHLLNRELVKARGIFSFREFRAEDYRPGAKPLREKVLGRNLALETGSDHILNVYAGITGTGMTNANALLGVGDGTAAADRADTDLTGLSISYKAMSPSYPQMVDHAMVWRAVFIDEAESRFEWCEAVLKDTAGGVCFNRCLFDTPETKVSGYVWECQYAVSIW